MFVQLRWPPTKGEEDAEEHKDEYAMTLMLHLLYLQACDTMTMMMTR